MHKVDRFHWKINFRTSMLSFIFPVCKNLNLCKNSCPPDSDDTWMLYRVQCHSTEPLHFFLQLVQNLSRVMLGGGPFSPFSPLLQCSGISVDADGSMEGSLGFIFTFTFQPGFLKAFSSLFGFESFNSWSFN